MKDWNGTKIIGLDHGYGNIKTANCCFKNGILGYDTEPLFTSDMLVYDGRYYLIGEGHKEFLQNKVQDEDYYLLTLVGIAKVDAISVSAPVNYYLLTFVGIAKELTLAGLTEAHVCIAAGLPLTWTSGQKEAFKAYLSRNKEVRFTYRRKDYHIFVDDVRIYPQGYAAVASTASGMKGVNLIADIGNGTMNVLFITNGKPLSGKMFTEKFGTYQCTLAIREAFMRQTQRELNEAIIDEMLCAGTADIAEDDLSIIRATATEYVADIFRRLREHGYDEKTMTLHITGGGGCLVRNFYHGDLSRTKFVTDICAAAKGYEYLAGIQLKAEASR